MLRVERVTVRALWFSGAAVGGAFHAVPWLPCVRQLLGLAGSDTTPSWVAYRELALSGGQTSTASCLLVRAERRETERDSVAVNAEPLSSASSNDRQRASKGMRKQRSTPRIV